MIILAYLLVFQIAIMISNIASSLQQDMCVGYHRRREEAEAANAEC